MRHLNKPRGTLQQFITFPLVLFLCSISIQMDEWKFGDRDKPSQIQYNAFNIPLRFEENQGQIASSVKYFCRGGKAVVGLSEKEIQLAVGKRSVKMEFVGASNEVSLYGVNKLPGKVNYYLGNDSQRWKTKVPSYRRVKYENIYSGIDLFFYGNQRTLEYDFVIAPGADYKVIQLAYKGAETIEIDKQGNLVINADGISLHQKPPIVYQDIEGVRKNIEGGYVLYAENRVGFNVGDYDLSKPLTIDPVLNYSTYLGGSGYDFGNSVAVDKWGCAYVVGWTASLDFLGADPLDSILSGGVDLFITKISSDGSQIEYGTYMGGTRYDAGGGIVVDANGYAYIAGTTYSTDFPVKNAIQPSNRTNDDSDLLIVKLYPDGTIVFSTYLGGYDGEYGKDVTLDFENNIYLTGSTQGNDFPLVNPIQGQYGGGNWDGIVTKLSSDGSTILYSTMLGGQGDDIAYRIDCDANGCAHIIGGTSSPNFPIANALQPDFRGGHYNNEDAFVAKLSPDGGYLIYSTYLGGTSDDRGWGISVDDFGNAFVTGITGSSDFPLVNPIKPSLGYIDVFISKINSSGTNLIVSTYFGGSGFEARNDVAVDASGNVLIVGASGSNDFPTTPNAIQKTIRGRGSDVFLIKLDPNISSVLYSTLLGGTEPDGGIKIAVDRCGNAYMTGGINSVDFPTLNPIQSTYGGMEDAFLVKISFEQNVAIDVKPGSFPNAINLRSNGNVPVAILGTSAFDVTKVNPTTVKFAEAFVNVTSKGTPQFSYEDVNKDGYFDAVFHFSTRALNLAITDTVGYLSGALFDGNLIEGTDKIRVVKEVEKWARDIPSIDNSSSQTNSVFSLQNYPSPFNPETTIEYALTKSGFVSLKVYDMLGREVAELVNERKRAGTYRVDFNGTKLTSGVYLYRLTAGDQIETKRMLLVK